MRTNWVSRATVNRPSLLPDYEPYVGALLNMMDGLQGQERGDPVKVAEVVLQLAYEDELPAHLLLGKDAHRGPHLLKNSVLPRPNAGMLSVSRRNLSDAYSFDKNGADPHFY